MTPKVRAFVQEFLEQGREIFTSGTLYVLEQPDELQLWWVTPYWERHELRLAAFEVEGQMLLRAPWSRIELRIPPPELVAEIPSDATPVVLGRTVTGEEIEQVLDEEREILEELAKH